MTLIKTTLHINSGICVCGCHWEEHHLSAICNKNAYEAIKIYIEKNCPERKWKDSDGAEFGGYPMYMPGECEKFGFNEVGGMKYNANLDCWEDHCHRYRDKDGPLGEVEWKNQ